MKLIFLDTETTGLKNPRLVQLTYCFSEEGSKPLCLYYNPGVDIEIGAMAIHHITPEKIKDALRFQESTHYNELKTLFEGDAVMVAHNAQFDAMVLSNEGIHVPRQICTYKVARALFPEAEKHTLQYIRYYLKYQHNAEMAEGIAHSADGDVAILKTVFMELYKRMPEFQSGDALNAMLRISSGAVQAVKIDKFNFGKYKGRTFAEIAKVDRGYLIWLLNSENQKSSFDRNNDLVFTINSYLK